MFSLKRASDDSISLKILGSTAEAEGAGVGSLVDNFVNKLTGSFEKLRLDCIQKQPETLASGSTGFISLFDYSQNGFSMTGTGYLTGYNNFETSIINYSNLSPYFDETATSDKVRPRGLQDYKNIVENSKWARTAPVYYVPRNDEPIDDLRFSVDFSLVDSLNKDIVNLFASYETLNNAIGDPNLLFSTEYPDIEKLRDVYFNRLSSKINFEKFFEFYRWFDTSIATFIDQLLPKKTRFKGVNFMVEPHMLERSKHNYYYFENYSLRTQNFDPSKIKPVGWSYDVVLKKY